VTVVGAARPATEDEKPRLAAVTARAFERDPVLGGWVFRDPATRLPRLEALFTMALSGTDDEDHAVLTTEDLAGMALWHHRRPAPEEPAAPADDGGAGLFAAAMAGAGFLPEEADRMLTFVGTMGDVHPHDEHWYLNILAADPDRQGQGIGSACIVAHLLDVDSAGLPAYLESTNERNVPLYERHGFRTIEVLELPDDGPPIWAMWRDGR
jgi:ribosomal protein S18 acetylase RimI-like enzyme